MKAALRIEDVFSSKGRVRILRILAEISQLNASEIARRAGLNYATASQHLKVLETSGLVRQRKFGRVRMYRFLAGSLRAQAVRHLVEVWEKTENQKSR
jgi:DNA-binding transcriptional ArsR family regulator